MMWCVCAHACVCVVWWLGAQDVSLNIKLRIPEVYL